MAAYSIVLPASGEEEVVSAQCFPIGREPVDLAESELLASNVPVLPPEVCSWERFRGDGFALRVPPGFEDIMPEPEPDDQPKSTLSDGRSKSPFVARFASPGRLAGMDAIGLSLGEVFLKLLKAGCFAEEKRKEMLS